ncbi:MAG: glycosyltransferase family 2 protein [Patescibacteria group bacterium]
MLKKVAIIISPNYKDYAEKYLEDCINSLRKQDYQGELKIFISDNASSDKSYVFLKKTAPEVEIIKNKNNDGFAKGNNDAMRLAINRGFEYIILFNLDTIVDKNAISEMVKAAESDSRIGAVQARLMLWPEKEKINSLGNDIHFLGFGYCWGYGQKYKKNHMVAKNIAYPSGAAVLFKTEVLKKVGLFDEEYWMYNEDQDLGWRIWLAGYKCVLAPKAVVCHKYKFARSIKNYYWMDRNRIITIIKNYHTLTLLLIFPAFIIMELGLLVFSLANGWFKEKLKIYYFFLLPKNWKYLLKARSDSQKLRKVKDKDIAKRFSGRIWYQEIDDLKLRIINPIFNLYWQIIKKIIIW